MAKSSEENIKKEGFSTLVVSDEEVEKIYNLITSINEKLEGTEISKSSEELLFRWKSIIIRNWSSLSLESSVVVRYIVEYCLSQKNYYFTNDISINTAIKRGVKIDMEYMSSNPQSYLSNEKSLYNMVNEAVLKGIEYRDNVENFIKSDFIKVCYSALREYKRHNLNPTQKRQFTHYKLTVITGLIVLKMKPELFDKFEHTVKKNERLSPSEIKGIIVSETNKCRI